MPQTFRDVPMNRNLLVLFDVRVVTRNAKTGAFTSHPFGWSFLPVLSDFGSVASTSAQLPLFQGEVNLVPANLFLRRLRNATQTNLQS